MTEPEKKALSHIATATDPAALLQMARNARGKSPTVERAALRRLTEVSAAFTPGTVEHACWQMVHAVEALRRLNGRKVARMNRMRSKIEKDGEIGALEYCALNKTDGFDEVMDYGMPELTAEAIVLRHPSNFSSAALATAQARLEQRGVQIDHEHLGLKESGSSSSF
ncbi:hypothetical protein [Rhizobium leguminosarum]|uniref:hypothetical protein n=1 Tax=Rhizobium leguminosarum TaxID=384 RepID=UPI00103089D4|nr:hypothetical protein [Rhizobium leguminosarum]TBF89178.1 hypothetical protein ELG82_37165 [Rhizobium leguminosarum]